MPGQLFLLDKFWPFLKLLQVMGLFPCRKKVSGEDGEVTIEPEAQAEKCKLRSASRESQAEKQVYSRVIQSTSGCFRIMSECFSIL